MPLPPLSRHEHDAAAEAEHAPELRLMRDSALLVVGATFVPRLFIGVPSWRSACPGLGPLLANSSGAAPGAAVIGLPVVFVLTIALVAMDGPAR